MNILPEPKFKVELIAENGKHFYSVDGSKTYLPGVTGILGVAAKDALLPWASKQTALYCAKIIKRVQDLQKDNSALSEYLSDRFLGTLVARAKKQPHFMKVKAAEQGTLCHDIFEKHITGKLLLDNLLNPPVPVKSYLLWRKTERLQVVGGDMKVASVKHGYGGSLDVLLQDEQGNLVVGDFKTSNYIFDSMAAQVASYCVALAETYGLKDVPRGIIIRFDKEKVGYERREVSSTSDSFKMFKACQDLYDANQLIHFSNRETVRPEKVKKAAVK